MLVTLASIVIWLGLEILAEVYGEATGILFRPVTRPIWRAFVTARWPWPLVLGLSIGLCGSVEGYSLLSAPDWRASAGLSLFFGGGGVFLCTLVLWYESRRESVGRR